MASKQLSLHHLVHFPASSQLTRRGSATPPPTLGTGLREATPPKTDRRFPTILALHGRGSNEQDLVGLASHLPDNLLWISPRAPLTLGPDSYEWYRVKVIGRPDPEQVLSALETMDHFIDEILEAYTIDPQKLFLLGFSQGSLISMCYTLTYPSPIAGVIAQSGYIPNGVDLEINEAGVKDKPFILTHGEQDTLIPIEWGRASRDRLQELGVDLTYHEFHMGHHVSMESLSVISTWLEKQLAVL